MGNTIFDRQDNWRGVKQVFPSAAIFESGLVNNNSLIIYTVPSGRTFYLVATEVNCNANVIGSGYLSITDSNNNTLFTPSSITVQALGAFIGSVFTPAVPIPLLSGYNLYLVSTASGVSVRGSIIGWLE